MGPPLQSRFIDVDGIRTHYFDVGTGPVLVLLHSGEFGASAEITWEFNIPALAEHFRVLAPDWLGYGQTEKLFDFDNMWERRVRHIAAFLRQLRVAKAHFAGNSMGGSMLVTVAAMPDSPWPIDRMVIASGGGVAPENEARRILNDYDGSREHMRNLVRALIRRADLVNSEDYLERRYQSSLIPGAWECAAAARFRMPGRGGASAPRPATYSTVPFETLLIAGAQDNLRKPGYADEMRREIARSKLVVIEHAGHCPQIDQPDAFNKFVSDFLR